jgi:hypothetical protein
MLNLMFGGHDLLVFRNFPQGRKTDGCYFWDVACEEARRTVIAITKSWKRRSFDPNQSI